MSFGRELKRRCKAAIAPVVFMGVTGYFAWSATHGDHGLHTSRLDPDTLDQQARAMLNLADPNDVVVMYGPGKKLF
jgi:hypothetical protein